MGITDRPGFDTSDKTQSEIALADSFVSSLFVWYEHIPAETAYAAAQAALSVIRTDSRVVV